MGIYHQPQGNIITNAVFIDEIRTSCKQDNNIQQYSITLRPKYPHQ